ncbi:MAG: hypothetical protein AAFW98_13235 [Pseudomonadota bacterium]
MLDLAADAPFARRLVNSGRLSTPANLPLADAALGGAEKGVPVGAPAVDAPVMVDGEPGWLLDVINAAGPGFTMLSTGPGMADLTVPGTQRLHVGASGALGVGKTDVFTERYGDDTAYLLRPDQHVAARFDRPDVAAVGAALCRAKGLEAGPQ